PPPAILPEPAPATIPVTLSRSTGSRSASGSAIPGANKTGAVAIILLFHDAAVSNSRRKMRKESVLPALAARTFRPRSGPGQHPPYVLRCAENCVVAPNGHCHP